MKVPVTWIAELAHAVAALFVCLAKQLRSLVTSLFRAVKPFIAIAATVLANTIVVANLSPEGKNPVKSIAPNHAAQPALSPAQPALDAV